MTCLHCRRNTPIHARGLCKRDWLDLGIREMYQSQQCGVPRPEPTAEEIETVVAEQLAKLPPWYCKEAEQQRAVEHSDRTALELDRARTERFKARTRVPRQWR